jgi:integral membrane sensor domain MASE1
MLNWFHDHLGFGGSILITFFSFLLAIAWLSGIAGIAEESKNQESFSWKLFLALFLPPVPIIWLFVDMYRQHRYLRRFK